MSHNLQNLQQNNVEALLDCKTYKLIIWTFPEQKDLSISGQMLSGFSCIDWYTIEFE